MEHLSHRQCACGSKNLKKFNIFFVPYLTQAELDSMQTVSEKEEIPYGELAELSVLESFDKDRLKVLIDKVIVYGSDAIEIVWKVGNPFRTETTA